MTLKNFDINKALQKYSSRHHYIPRFLIEGFANSEGLLYIFDKKKDKILKKPQAPKGIFFEWDRNTIELRKGIESSILEDELYSRIDNQASKIVKYFQNEELQKIDFTVENTAQFLFFLVTLFWRIPYTDFASEDLMDRSEIISNGPDPETLRLDPTFRKLERSRLFEHAVSEMRTSGKKGVKSINIHQLSGDFVIGDNPLIFKKKPTLFKEFGEMDFMIALNSRRIYSSTNNKLENLTAINAALYNIAVIDQSVRYIGCRDLNSLQQSIESFTKLKSQGYLLKAAEGAFET